NGPRSELLTSRRSTRRDDGASIDDANGLGPPASSQNASSQIAFSQNAFSQSSASPSKPENQLRRMQRIAKQLVQRYPEGSRIAVLDRSGNAVSFAIDRSTAIAAIDRVTPRMVISPMDTVIESAVRLVRTSDIPQRMVIVVSAMRRASFPSLEDRGGPADGMSATVVDKPQFSSEPSLTETRPDAQASGARPTIARTSEVQSSSAPAAGGLADLLNNPSDVELVFWDSSLSSIPSNRSIVSAAIQQGPATAGVSVPIRVALQSFGAVDDDAQLELQLFQQSVGLPVVRNSAVQLPPRKTVDRQRVNWNGGSSNSTAGETPGAEDPISLRSASATLHLPALEVGTHHAVVQWSRDDALSIDDARYLTIDIQQQRRVLICSPNVDVATDFAWVISSPHAPDDPRSPYGIDMVTADQLALVDFEDYAAVVLLDPPPPSRDVRNALTSWVEGGGRCFLALGKNVRTEGDDQIAEPFRQWPATQGVVRIWRSGGDGTFLQPIAADHAALRVISRIPGGVPWSAYPIFLYWQIDQDKITNDDRTLIRFAGEPHAALLQRNIGNGSVLLMTTPLPAIDPESRRWNDLFGENAWPAFLLSRGIVAALAAAGDPGADPRNVVVGDAIVLPVGESAAESAADGQADVTNAQPYQLFASDGSTAPLRSSAGSLVVGTIESRGTYWVRGQGTTDGFSVNLPPDAFDLSPMDSVPEYLDQWVGADEYQLVRSAAELKEIEQSSSTARPLYAHGMLAVLAIFLLEQLLGNRFYGGNPRADGNATPLP
ncbi:MAG: hypothetical protein AAFN70_05405, partial [Planctomycetota bacterium]